MDPTFEALAERLAAIEEELRDLAYERLADQARDPDGDAAAAAKEAERRLNQARRAVARAVAALGGGPDTLE
jgi:hypothetical protein